MNPIDLLKELLNTFSKKAKYKDREMKRVFQWRRYLEWEGLSKHEKLAAKRLFFIPIAAYFVFVFINRHVVTLVFLIGLFFVYKKLEKGKLLKWDLSFLASFWLKRLTNKEEERIFVSSWTASKRSNWYNNYVATTTEKRSTRKIDEIHFDSSQGTWNWANRERFNVSCL